MKKTCTGCPAFYYNDFSGRCLLGNDIEHYDNINMDYGSLFLYRPVRNCVKPRSVRQFCEMSIERSKSLGENDWRG